MHYPVDRDLSSGYRYPPFEQLGPGCLLPSQLVHIQVLLPVIHSCCVNGASSETQGQIVGAWGSVNTLYFSWRHFFSPVYTPPPPHPQLPAPGSPRMLQDGQGSSFSLVQNSLQNHHCYVRTKSLSGWCSVNIALSCISLFIAIYGQRPKDNL